MAWSVNWQVTVGGQNMTDGMRPYLISIEVNDRDGVEQDGCDLAFDDLGGQLRLPPVRTPVSVSLESVSVFEGFVDSTPWSLARGGGRILKVSCKAFDTRGKASENQHWHMDDADFGAVAKKAGGLAGYSVVVDGALGAIKRDYWSPDGMSFIAWGEKMRKELGATFKLRGNQAVFAARGQGISAGGGLLPSVAAVVGTNVLNVEIDPSKGRPRAKTRKVRWFDRKSATFKEKEVQISLDDTGDALETQRWMAVDEGQAGTMADGHKTDAERNSGVGSIELNLTPEAMAEGTLTLVGARDGIDGSYRISSVTQKADRSGGATTRCELAQPQGGAGKDNRKAGADSGSSSASSSSGSTAVVASPATGSGTAGSIPGRGSGSTDAN